MIEYDKANVTSSYPSLTEYEVATVLDKAYNALIAQKVTGNNVRRASLESDLKAITDIAPLVKQDDDIRYSYSNSAIAQNVMSAKLPDKCLYFLQAYLKYTTPMISDSKTKVDESTCNYDSTQSGLSDPGHIYGTNVFKLNTYDNNTEDILNYELLYDGTDTTFRYCKVEYTPTEFADDWTARDIVADATIEDIKRALFVNNHDTYPYVFVWLDNKSSTTDKFTVNKVDRVMPYDTKTSRIVPTSLVTHEMATKFYTSAFNMPWIKTPVCYIEDDNIYVVYDLLNAPKNQGTIVYIKIPNKFAKDDLTLQTGEIKRTYFTVTATGNTDITSTIPEYQFECNDTVAEELISLAVAFALENVESARLNSKLNMRGLEA
jgi:hypothetical protein